MSDLPVAGVTPWTDGELRTMLGSMAAADPEQVCAYAAVVVRHDPEGTHTVMVVKPAEYSPRDVARLFAHAGLHALGQCRQCGQPRKRFRRVRG